MLRRPPNKSWLFASLREFSRVASALLVSIILFLLVAALAVGLLLRSGLIFDHPLDESRACSLAMEHARRNGMVPAKCGRFASTDSVGNICVFDARGSPLLYTMLGGGALPFEKWHVIGDDAEHHEAAGELAQSMCRPEQPSD